MMMRSSKDDGDNKVSMEPMFPRLHINDADKGGGPRAPPRNKMALYEQLSVPSKTTTSNQNPASKECGQERMVVSSFYMPQAPAHSFDRGNSRSSDGMNGNVSRTEFEKRLINHKSSKTLISTRPVTESSGLRQNESNTKESRGQKLDDTDDFRVPSFNQLGRVALSINEEVGSGPLKLTSSNSNNSHKRHFGTLHYSTQNPSLIDKSSETNTSNFRHRSIDRSLREKSKDTIVITEIKERSATDKVTDRSTTSLFPVNKDVKSLHGDSVAYCETYQNEDVRLNIKSCEASTIRNQLNTKQSLCSKESTIKGRRTSNMTDFCSQSQGTKQSSDAGRNDEVPKSTSCMEICPDDVVGVIGPKHFWKARSAIVNQQRVFAVQVFELHRLIKVQKLIAGSPHLLLDSSNHQSKSPQDVPANIVASDSNNSSQQVTARQKEKSQKQDHDLEMVTENIDVVPPLPGCKDKADQGLEGQIQHSSSTKVPPLSTASDNKPGAWCFHHPADQWLVPVVIPSEGLVYKPFRGPCPPTGGFMAPLFGSCPPPNATMAAGDFVNHAYGVLGSHRPPSMGVIPGGTPVVPNYYPAHYGLPAMNPVVSSSMVEQVSSLAGPQPDGQMDQHSRSSCNMSNARSEAYSTRLCKMQVSKDSELQGSTTSCPSEKARVEGKDLFPRFQTTNNLACLSQSNNKNNQTRVIKVVPHNARSASESAARIFQSIQEERQHL